MNPIVAIVGRANVGKSTLFNRLTRSRQALVDNHPGVTRDRNYGTVNWEDQVFTLVDTGGFEWTAEELGDQVRGQAELAVSEADAILFMVDGRLAPQVGDAQVAEFLRRSGKPVLLVVNKIDGPRQEAGWSEFYTLGLSPIFPISAEHGLGITALLEAVVTLLPPLPEVSEADAGIRVAVLGRPNVGKSSFINRFLGEERLVTSPLPGTTRDAVDSQLVVGEQPYVLIDTAGIRRKSRIWEDLEQGMVWQAFRALERAEVALLLLDAQEGLTEQDLKIVGQIVNAGKAVVIGINKWDLLTNQPRQAQRLLDQVKSGLEFMAYAPLLPISVKTGYNLPRVFPLIYESYRQSSVRLGTAELNKIFNDIITRHAPPRYRHRPVKFYYVTQVNVLPLTFMVFTNFPQGISESYRRYLSKQLRARLALPWAPIKLICKGRDRRHRESAPARSVTTPDKNKKSN
ncbi:MAG: ribosome biogenesis GTPase Der [Desulfobacca sp.]|nr:ribosome biogenesis GTPase Der [Desulfobacca sp.]